MSIEDSGVDFCPCDTDCRCEEVAVLKKRLDTLLAPPEDARAAEALINAALMPPDSHKGVLAAAYRSELAKRRAAEAGWGPSHAPAYLDITSALTAERAKSADLAERLEEAVQALEAMQEFHDCMEAQRTGAPLPEGHDDESYGCGDGTCYVVGAIIQRGIATAKSLRLSTKAPVESKPCASPCHKDGCPVHDSPDGCFTVGESKPKEGA